MTTANILHELGVVFVEGGSHKSVREDWNGFPICPFCGHGDYYAAMPNHGFAFSCWACGSKPFVQAICRLSGKPWAEIKKLLGDVQFEDKPERPVGQYLPPESPISLTKRHRDYLHSRGVNAKVAEGVWKVSGFGHFGCWYAWSLFLPVFLNGRPVSWTTRRISNVADVRYRCAPKERE